MAARARTIRPSVNVSSSSSPTGRSAAVSHGAQTRTPNLMACSVACPIRAPPLTPNGKPRKFSIREVDAACPPGAIASSSRVRRPSDAA